ncbi:MAG: calcium/sodium antiporter [Pseudomonadales bacterium]|nr:calcium/sodium antiporter [Pseudomonadales bacterium]
MWLLILALVFGFTSLVWSSDRFVSGAASTAKNFGLSPLLIGLTVVSIGTSAPEILVSLTASLEGAPIMAIGNAIGSNIANIGLVLGITAIVTPLPFADSVLKQELPWLIGATIVALIALSNLYLGRMDGLMLLAGLSVIMYRLAQAQRRVADSLSESSQDEIHDLPDMSTMMGLVHMLSGLVILLASAQLLVWAATEIALLLGVSNLVIGLSIVAIGTSLPELAATISAALKGHSDIAIGTVVGSNIINILAVLSVPALVHPIALSESVLWRDGSMLLALTMLLVLFAYGINSRRVLTRFEGSILLLAWCGYNFLLYSHAG